ncbi:MAG: hypothetical protein AAF721_00805 [Myxococcota bacterium]
MAGSVTYPVRPQYGQPSSIRAGSWVFRYGLPASIPDVSASTVPTDAKAELEIDKAPEGDPPRASFEFDGGVA